MIDENLNQDEIDANSAIAMAALKHPSQDDLKESIMDMIANLLILAHENEIEPSEVVVRGSAHYLATYMEGMDADEADEWLNETLFPWSGENDFEFYIARDAITLAGHEGNVEIPEFGV